MAQGTRGAGAAAGEVTGVLDELRVEALAGRIFLDSPPGAGTRLRVELPLTASDDASLFLA